MTHYIKGPKMMSGFVIRLPSLQEEMLPQNNKQTKLTILNPLCPRLPTPSWHPSLCNQERDSCKTCSLISANMLLRATSSDVFCSKFGEFERCCEFSKLRDGRTIDAHK